jgi:hypothetical protein
MTLPTSMKSEEIQTSVNVSDDTDIGTGRKSNLRSSKIRQGNKMAGLMLLLNIEIVFFIAIPARWNASRVYTVSSH